MKGLDITKKNGPVLTLLEVTEDDEVMLVTDRGKIIRLATEGIRLIGRVTQGVKLIDTDLEEKVVSVAKVVERSDDGEDAS